MLKKRSLIVLVALVFIFLIYSEPQFIESTPVERPVRNVILICMDTVRYDSFWLPESLDFKDPFSGWANQAVRFRNAQSTSSWTVPAVASAITGLYPAEHRAGQFKTRVANLDQDLPSSMPENIATLTKLLDSRGFSTLAIVGSPFIPLVFPAPQKPPGVDTIFEDDQIVKNAITALQLHVLSKIEQPFFLYLHLMGAHEGHWEDPQILRERNQALPTDLRNGIIRLAPGKICNDPCNHPCLGFQDYVHSILMLREKMARLLNFLQETDQIQDTVVILFSDHGEEFEDHLATEEQRPLLVREFRGLGHGHTMYQELLHVPMLVWHPDYSGREITVPVSLVDITPTIAEWLSMKNLAFHWSGKSLAKISLLNHRADLLNRPIFSSGIAYGKDKTAVLWKQWKTITLDPDESVMFNLQSDPLEIRAWNQPGPGFVLDQYLAQYMEAPFWWQANHQKIDEEQLEMLRSIGYLGMGDEL